MCGQYGIFSQLLKLKFVRYTKQNQNRLAVEEYSILKHEVVGELIAYFSLMRHGPHRKRNKIKGGQTAR
jgi:hypothetical protein